MPTVSGLTHRFTQLAREFRYEVADSAAPFKKFRHFRFEMALSVSPAALPMLVTFAHDGRVLFSSAHP